VALITAAEARDLIPGLTGTGQDARLDEYIAAAGALMAAFVGFPPASAGVDPTLEDTTYTEYYDGEGGLTLRLDLYPVLSVTSVYDDPNRAYGADTLVSSSDYDLDGRRGLLLLKPNAAHGAWSDGELRAIKVTFVAGFATVPSSIKRACAQEAKRLLTARATQGQASASKGGQSVSFRDPGLLPETREILAPLRLPRAIL
jgi:hypothetical protein